MPFWTLRRKVVATVTLMIALTFGWAAVVVAVALTGAHDEARSADAIAVLGAAQYNGRPSPVFRARLDHAAALYQRGLAPVVQPRAEHGRWSAVVLRGAEHGDRIGGARLVVRARERHGDHDGRPAEGERDHQRHRRDHLAAQGPEWHGGKTTREGGGGKGAKGSANS